MSAPSQSFNGGSRARPGTEAFIVEVGADRQKRPLLKKQNQIQRFRNETDSTQNSPSAFSKAVTKGGSLRNIFRAKPRGAGIWAILPQFCPLF